ncbi:MULTISPECIES: transposase [Pirellulaceae]|uniref:transposase n=1 Tax=Pirellulaceae TaxID=2691357 RepID=UPI0011B050EC|nr:MULTISPECIES: transposase [Pirellulaceae]
MIDRALYVRREWADDAEHRIEANILEEITLVSKPVLACEMPVRALKVSIPAFDNGRRGLELGPQFPGFLLKASD